MTTRSLSGGAAVEAENQRDATEVNTVEAAGLRELRPTSRAAAMCADGRLHGCGVLTAPLRGRAHTLSEGPRRQTDAFRARLPAKHISAAFLTSRGAAAPSMPAAMRDRTAEFQAAADRLRVQVRARPRRHTAAALTPSPTRCKAIILAWPCAHGLCVCLLCARLKAASPGLLLSSRQRSHARLCSCLFTTQLGEAAPS